MASTSRERALGQLGARAQCLPCSSTRADSTAPCYEHTALAEAAKCACAAANAQQVAVCWHRGCAVRSSA